VATSSRSRRLTRPPSDHDWRLGSGGIISQLGPGPGGRYGLRAVPGHSLIAIRTGGSTSCGITAAGETLYWGGNWMGQLGTGSDEYGDSNPTVIAGGTASRSSASASRTPAESPTPVLPTAGAATSEVSWGLGYGEQRDLASRSRDVLEEIARPEGAPAVAREKAAPRSLALSSAHEVQQLLRRLVPSHGPDRRARHR
jgi:hypothetical protein